MEFISLNSDFNYNFLANINGIKLTNRQIDVAACLIGRQKYKEIGRILSISPSTVDEHLKKTKAAINNAGSFRAAGILEFFENSDCYKHLREHYVGILIQHAFENALSKIANSFRSAEKYVIKYHSDINRNSFINKKIREHLKLVGINFDIDNSTSFHHKDDSGRKVIYIIPKHVGSALKEVTDKSNSTIYITQEPEKLFEKAKEEQSEQLKEKTPSIYHEGFFKLLHIISKDSNIDQYVKELDEKKLILEKNLINNGFSNNLDIVNKDNNKLTPRTRIGKLYDVCIKHKIILVTMLLLTMSIIMVLGKIHDQQVQKEVVADKIAESLTFNLPRQLDYYTPRSEVTKLVWDKLLGDNSKKTAILASLHGLGGVGKTTLALNAIHNPNQRYDFKGWFRAENKELLKIDYFELGEKLSLFEQGMSDKLKLSKVKDWLDKNNKTLLVYDNAPDMETLNDFLPHNGHIIITSRNYKLPEAIEVDVMTPEEGLQLLERLFPDKVKRAQDYPKQAKMLIKELGYLPLAISQAGAYISENMLMISNYLKLYEAQKEKLLRKHTLPPEDKHEPVYVTWDMNIQSIKKQPYGDKALELLDFISYCYPENSPKKLLMQYLYDKTNSEAEIEFNSVLKLLRQYSLIKVYPNAISIHRLVHNWIKHKHSKEDKLTILKKGMKRIETIYPWENKTAQEITLTKSLMPHVQAILFQLQSLVNEREVANLISILGDIYFIAGDYDKSLYFLNKSIAINEKFFGLNHIKIAFPVTRLGWVYFELGDFNKSKDAFEKMLLIKKKNNIIYNDNVTYALRGLGWICIKLGDNAKAIQLFTKNLVLAEKHYGPYHIETFRNLISVGWANLCLGDLVKAKQFTEKAILIGEKNGEKDHNVMSVALSNLGWIENHIGDYIKARQLFEKAFVIKKEYYDPEHRQWIFPLAGLGWANLWLGDNAKARKALEQSFAITKKAYDLDHIHVAFSFINMGWMYFNLGDYLKSKELFKKALAIKEKHFGDNHLDTAVTLNDLSWTYLCLSDYIKARQLLDKSASILAKSYGDNNLITVITFANQGNLYRILGNTKESKELLEQSLSFLQEYFKENNINIAKVMGNLGLLYGDLGDNAKKKEYLEKALIVFEKNLPSEHMDIKRTKDELKGVNGNSIKLGPNKDKQLGYLIILPL